MKKGFTLIELLVVMAIIVVLVSVVVLSLEQAKERGQKDRCYPSKCTSL